MQVFISWRGSSRELKNEMKKALEEALSSNDKVWESDADCTSDFSINCMKAISESQVFVVIINDEAMKPSYLINEVIDARKQEMEGNLNIVVYKVTDTPYTYQLEMNLNHISDANFVSRLKSTNDGINEVVKRVTTLFELRKNGTPELPMQAFSPAIDGVPMNLNNYFVEHSRDEELSSIEEAFKKSNVIFLSQMNGYGKKSTIRKYVDSHNDMINHVLLLNGFSGSLRNFFLEGLQFTNISPSVYEGCSEDEIIHKKASFLAKSNEHLLLVVPNTKISPDDENYLDELSQAKCNICFITEYVPQFVSDAFPHVNIGRMKNEYLSELFYHYLNKNIENQETNSALYKLFEKISGHTKTVEIIARTLAQEVGLSTKDVVLVLNNLFELDNSGLSNHVADYIYQMFEMQKLSKDDCIVLKVASLYSTIPVIESEFIDVLSNFCKKPQQSILRLIELGWLYRDDNSQTISIEPIMANICYEKMNYSDAFLKNYVYVLFIDLNEDCINSWLKHLVSTFDRLLLLYSLLDKTTIYNTIFSIKDSFLFPGKEFKPIEQLPTAEGKQRKNFVHGKKMSDIDNYIITSIYPTIMSLKNNINKASFDNLGKDSSIVVSSVKKYVDLLYDFKEFSSENIEVRLHLDFINKGIKNKNEAQVYLGLQLVVQDIFKHLESKNLLGDGDDEDGLFCLLLGLFGQQIMNPSLAKIMLNTCEYILSSFGDFISDNNKYLYFRLKVMFLYNSGNDGNEIDLTYSNSHDYFIKLEFPSSEDREINYDTFICLSKYYCDSKIRNKEYSKAIDALTKACNLPITDKESKDDRLSYIVDLFNTMIKNGEVENAKLLYDSALTKNVLKDVADYNDFDSFECMKKARAILDEEAIDSSFLDESEEYKNYYETYGSSLSDQLAIRKYTRIAKEVMAYDFSNFDRSTLVNRFNKIREEVVSGVADPNRYKSELLAIASEAGFRTLGYRAHYVQILGSAAIVDGKIAEIQNGEGKTLSIMLAAIYLSVANKQVHIIDSSKYLSTRNYEWMHEVAEFLELNVFNLETYKDDFSKANIVYGTFESFIFYQLSKEFNITNRFMFDCAIVDEADESMIAQGNHVYFLPDKERKERNITLNNLNITEKNILWEALFACINGVTLLDTEKILVEDYKITIKEPLRDGIQKALSKSVKDIFPDFFVEKNIDGLIREAEEGLFALLKLERRKDYFVVDDYIKYENRETGLLKTIDNFKSFCLAKREKVNYSFEKISSNEILSETTVFAFFKQYKFLSGATATASSMRKEFEELYDLKIIQIPPNKPILRIDNAPELFITRKTKNNKILEKILEAKKVNRPVLVISSSILESEELAKLLKDNKVDFNISNGENYEDGIQELKRAGELGKITLTTAMANRGVDILLGGNPKEFVKQHLLSAGKNELLIEHVLNNLGDYSKNTYRGEKYQIIRNNAISLYALYKEQTDEYKKEVIRQGGLLVIGTCCFPSLRTEQQVRGRCGRQGDAGESIIYYSIQDDTFKNLFGTKAESLELYCEQIGTEKISVSNRFINANIKKAREKMQLCQYKDITKSYSELYYKDAKALFVKPINYLISHDFDLIAMYKEILSGHKFADKERRNNILKNASIEIFDEEQSVTRAIIDYFKNAYSNYLNKMKVIIAQSQNINKTEQFLEDAISTASKMIAEDEFFNACEMLLNELIK